MASLEDERYRDLNDHVKGRLATFQCERSPHLQRFARERVSAWESSGHSRTYVFLVPHDEHGVDVAAFFTIGMTSLDFSAASRSLQKKLMGNISTSTTGAYSLAELARDDRYASDDIPGQLILEQAMQVVSRARTLVAGRFLVVDAQRAVFDHLYEPAGFKEVTVAKPPAGMEDRDFITACCVIKDL
ncbi:hypothetical protein [Microbacterium indicum]|uniref:hypothetical protein n=1 Tax=Microbacterium indicum TaxID=358100 RepID=UPI0012EC1C23|nr:hypothetical protein [Microbacterium indicum]